MFGRLLNMLCISLNMFGEFPNMFREALKYLNVYSTCHGESHVLVTEVVFTNLCFLASECSDLKQQRNFVIHRHGLNLSIFTLLRYWSLSLLKLVMPWTAVVSIAAAAVSSVCCVRIGGFRDCKHNPA